MNPSIAPIAPPTFNLYTKEYRANPYRYLGDLREHAPLYKIKGPNPEWLVTRYEDVKKIVSGKDYKVDDLPERLLRKNDLIKSGGNLNALSATIADWTIFVQPPDHTRLRKPLSKYFSPKELEKMRPFIQQDVHTLIRQAKAKGELEVIGDIAKRLPIMTSSRLLGIPAADHSIIYDWTNCLVDIFDQPNTLAHYQAMDHVTIQFRDYFKELIKEKRKRPDDQLISHLIHANDADQALSEDELLSTCSFLITAAQESTEAFMGNSILALLRNYDQKNWLRENPDKITGAVEELLRYDPPIQMLVRIPLQEVIIQDQVIQPGERILTSLAAANHDPSEFDQPEVLNLSRGRNNNIAFGHGIHACIGAWLARLEGQVLFNTIVQELPNMELATDQLSWYPNVFIRGLKALPVTMNL